MTIEARTRWQVVGDPPPESWRRCTSWFQDDGTLDVLFTNAPRDASPFAHDHVFVKYAPVRQERAVGEWADSLGEPFVDHARTAHRAAEGKGPSA